ncbi:MAG TPA: cob(I)yrinic acid a,c-diamide adenosyltransferase [Nitrospiria bacterium]|jgi:cob(I)alamin adenosyltransferase|nr:cob(I)yrinic acid a,c-diamide adenosyltransferase [Nitrospiria bacterium]
MRITRVYTRTGDKGKTRLAGGQMISKDQLRIEAYGTVDELNSAVGVVRAFNRPDAKRLVQARRLETELHRIQNRLFDIGGLLATLPKDQKRFKNLPRIGSEEVLHLEKLMDRCQKDLRPLKEFVLPTGGPLTAFLHLSRTICRRAERLCVRLDRVEGVDPEILKYLNRLSDALFVLARWMGRAHREPETLWDR